MRASLTAYVLLAVLALGFVSGLGLGYQMPVEPGRAERDLPLLTATPTPEHYSFLPIVARVAAGYPDIPFLFLEPLTGHRVGLAWIPVSNATGYRLLMSQVATMTNPTVLYAGQGYAWEGTVPDGMVYFRVEAVNQWGTSSSNIVSYMPASPTVTPPLRTPTPGPPPPCNLSCYADATGFGFNLSCETGPPQQSSHCYTVLVEGVGSVQRCEGTRTYANSGNTYSFVMEYWLAEVNGQFQYHVAVDVTGGAFGDQARHCQNY